MLKILNTVQTISFASFPVFLLSSLLFLKNIQIKAISFWEGDGWLFVTNNENI